MTTLDQWRREYDRGHARAWYDMMAKAADIAAKMGHEDVELKIRDLCRPGAEDSDPYFDMLWKWFSDESRHGAAEMRSNHDGLSAADFEEMLDEHEAALLGPRPVVSIKPMKLSDGRTDYYVSIKVGDRDVTPHVFREEYKAAYHVALYDWLLNGKGEEPSPVDFGPDDWPAQKLDLSALIAQKLADPATIELGKNLPQINWDLLYQRSKWPNGCDTTVPEALRYLANHPRPIGGQDKFNAEHLLQLASEIAQMASRDLYEKNEPKLQIHVGHARPRGAERYWEGRWRDEKAENERLAGALYRIVDWAMLYATEGSSWPDRTTITDPLIQLAAKRPPTQLDADAFKAGTSLSRFK